jgi:hypothetical protein
MLLCLTALPHTGHKTMLASSFQAAAHSSRKEHFTGLEMSLRLSKNFRSVVTLSRGAQAEFDFSVLTEVKAAGKPSFRPRIALHKQPMVSSANARPSMSDFAL